MALLEVNGIFKRFGKTEVLKGIDFSMEKGEVLAIIGSSGSGKTTLLRCLNFLETPDSGRIVLNGDEIYNAEAKYTDREIREKRLNFGLVFSVVQPVSAVYCAQERLPGSGDDEDKPERGKALPRGQGAHKERNRG